MDFEFNEVQIAVRDLAKKILGDLATPDSLRQLENSGAEMHRGVWNELAKAKLLGISLPEDVGGGGLGLTELCVLLETAGEHACPLPLLPSLVMAGLSIARFGSSSQQRALLTPLARGESILTFAIAESAAPVEACRDERAQGWLLSGATDFVPVLPIASHVLVPARTNATTLGVFIVDVSERGASIERQVGTSGEIAGRLELEAFHVADELVLGPVESGAEILAFARNRACLGQCALELGIAEKALQLTAKYTTERRQFGRPIGTFQAVTQRAADAYIDVETMRLSLWRAAWLVDQNRHADEEIAIARMIAGHAGHRVVCTAQHLHGGIGFDRDYPLYRYFLMSKQNEFALGSAASHTARLGRLLAEDDSS